MQHLYRDDSYAERCDATVVRAGPEGIRLDRTVFYPAGGGQPGDTGRLTLAGGTLAGGRTIAIVDTVKDPADGGVLHVPSDGSELPPEGAVVSAELDWDRRYRLMRMHTCLHLLCAIVPGGVTGGSIGDGKGRLDFDLGDQPLDKEAIAAQLNALVEADHLVRIGSISDEELAANPEIVRTMSVKPPTGSGRVRIVEIGPADSPVDRQPCGGTHVRRTGEVGRVLVAKIENKGRRNRRINLAFVE